MCARGRQKAHQQSVQENVHRIRTENWRGMRLFLCSQPDVLRMGRIPLSYVGVPSVI